MDYDVIVIGAGQAGLAMGYYLQKSNCSFLLLDQAAEVGETWRQRYDSLSLFTPRFYSALPGLKLHGNPDTYPTKDEIADYLASYAQKFALPIKQQTVVQELSLTEKGFHVMTNNGTFYAKHVVVATGPFHKPSVPAFAATLSDSVLQLHTAAYKNPSQLHDGAALVVGGGNSGAQIAVELAKERDVYLSVGHKMRFLSLTIGRKSIFWLFDKAGIYRAAPSSKIGQFIKKQGDPILGRELKTLIKSGAVKLKPRTIGVENNTFLFADNSKVKVTNVLWATGFTMDYQWIKIDGALDEQGVPIHQQGITPVQGLYFLGLPWQSSRSSALIQGVGRDAGHLFQQIITRN